MMRSFYGVVCVAVLLCGCLTTAEYEDAAFSGGMPQSSLVVDRHGDMQLVRRGRDLYVTGASGTSRKVTGDPYVEGGLFSKDGDMIVYLTAGPQSRRYTTDVIDVYADAFYIQPVSGDERGRREIDFGTYRGFLMEKIGAPCP